MAKSCLSLRFWEKPSQKQLLTQDPFAIKFKTIRTLTFLALHHLSLNKIINKSMAFYVIYFLAFKT